MGTASSFLTFAVFAAKRGLATSVRGRKSLYYLGGLTEGTETIALFVLICLAPSWFAPAGLGVRRAVLADSRKPDCIGRDGLFGARFKCGQAL